MKRLISTILTTNFDTCLPSALGQVRSHLGLIAEVNRAPGDVSELSTYPAGAQIVWLHGRAEQYSDKNLTSEVQRLDDDLVKRLLPFFTDCPLIVIGYRGAEPSIMEHLLGESAHSNHNFKNGIYWCQLPGEELHPNVEALQRQIGSNFKVLEIKGFDDLMEDLTKVLKDEDRFLYPTSRRAQSATPAFDDQPVPNASIGDLDHDLMIAVLRDYCEKLGRPAVTSDTLTGLLREQGLLVMSGDKEVPTRGCILLFGNDPSRWFPHAVVTTSINEKKRRVFAGNLIVQYRDLLEWLAEKDVNPVLKVKKRATHDERPAYPERALVELLVNMMVHRDYEVQQPSAISVQPGVSVSFVNPGRLLDTVTSRVEIDERGVFKAREEVSALRNRALCDIFFGMRAMERAGTGLWDAQLMLEEHGGASEFTDDAKAKRFWARVYQPAASAGSKTVARDERSMDTYVLNFIPFVSIPQTVSIVRLARGWDQRPSNFPFEEMGTFVLQGSKDYLWSFAPLPILLSLLGGYADQKGSKSASLGDIESDADDRRVLSWLLRKHFERHLQGFALRGLTLEGGKQKGKRAYFEGKDGRERCHVYDSPLRKNIQRWVVKARGKEGKGAWFENEGFGYEVARMDSVWGIRIKPFYMFTGRDAKRPLPNYMRTSRATRRMKLDRNQNVENDLTFWGRFLSQGAQTINIGQQHVDDLILEGGFLTVEVVEEGGGDERDQRQDTKAA